MGQRHTALFLHHGKGSKVYDEEGKEYIDYENSEGTCILGHANEKVVQAIKEATENGLSVGVPTRAEGILRELIKDTMPVAENIRFVHSSAEAIMSAIYHARAYTQREYIIQFTGCHHGAVHGVLTRNTLLAEYNDIGSVEELFWAYQDQIAAVIVEPVAVNMGLVPSKDGFLEYLREITIENGSLLILDETTTGYRLHLGGACEYYHIMPDLICLGKIIGGGLPIGAYGGKNEIMEKGMGGETPFLEGTGANPIAVAAGIATISELVRKKERYSRMEEQAVQIEERLKATLPGVQVTRVGSLLGIFFTKEEVVDEKSAKSSDAVKFYKYQSYLLGRGIYCSSSRFSTWYLSMAHKREDIKKTCDIIKSMKKGLFTE